MRQTAIPVIKHIENAIRYPHFVQSIRQQLDLSETQVLLIRVGIVRLIESGAEERGEESDGAARI